MKNSKYLQQPGLIRALLVRALLAPARLPSSTVRGFTLLELLTVIIILSILAAIATPAFFRQVNRSKEAEAKTWIGMINRAQQVYFTENSQFAPLASLEVNVSASQHYVYASAPDPAQPNGAAITTANPVDTSIKGFAGKVWSIPFSSGGAVSQSILCEGQQGSVPVIQGTTCP